MEEEETCSLSKEREVELIIATVNNMTDMRTQRIAWKQVSFNAREVERDEKFKGGLKRETDADLRRRVS